MANKHTRAGTLQQQRLIQIGTAAACVVFVGMALGAVVVDRSVTPAAKPNLPPAPPAGPGEAADEYEPFAPLIASGLSSVYKMDAPTTPDKGEGGDAKPTPPPQDIVLVAAIGQPGSMMAVIREGAAQTAIGEGQRGGSVDVLEVRPGWARVRHRGVERELTVGKPVLMVSDMGASPSTPMSSQIIRQPGVGGGNETMEERGVTTTRAPTGFQRAQSGNQAGGGQSGAGGGRRGGGGNGTGGAPGGGNGTANGTGGGQGAEDDR